MVVLVFGFSILDPDDLKSIGKTVLVEDMHTRKRNMLEQVTSRDGSFSGSLTLILRIVYCTYPSPEAYNFVCEYT